MKFPRAQSHSRSAAFTMIEVAICLAIIGFALVAIIGVLPLGMNTQRDNREETIINQDATVLLEAIRSAARGADDLTNFVFAITNYVTKFDGSGQPVNAATPDVYGYTFAASSLNGTDNGCYLTNATRIIGVLSTPEFTTNFNAIPSVMFGGYSNHVVAYVRAISGLAAEKPPQDNPIMREDTLTYRLLCVNAPMPVDTNLFYLYQRWSPATTYAQNEKVFYNWTYWQSRVDNNQGFVPNLNPAQWVESPNFQLKLAESQRELRLTFLWPVLPNGKLGNGRQTFRATLAGQLQLEYYAGQPLYFYETHSFTKAP